jgi:hypothetical protein
MLASKLKLTLILIILFVLSGMISCSKKTEQRTDNDKKIEAEKTDVDEKDFKENDEDLLKVDYKEFYDELSPHGEWIEVTDKDINEAMKNGTASNDGHKMISFADLFGIKDAHAEDAAFGAFFVWRPSPDIAVTIASAEPAPAYYVPYTNGQWVYTDAGWYFRAANDYEEITHHYGRWVFTPVMGWVWMPGRVWAPAWVDWREDDDYFAWEPIPPRIYIVNDVILTPPVYEDRYIFVERTHFYEPEIYNYVYTFNGHGPHIKIKDMRRLDGIMVINNTVINRGPDIGVVQNIRGSTIEMVKVNKVKDIGDVKFNGKEINSYSPHFTKVKIKGNLPEAYSKPEKFDKFSDFKSKKENRNEISGNENKNQGKAENLNKGKNRLSDDGNMKNGNRNQKDNNVNKQSPGNNKKNSGKDRSYNKKNYDKGGKNKRYKDNGNDVGGKRKNDNSSGYDKGNKNNHNSSKENGNKNNSGNRKGGKNKSNDNNGKIKGKENSGNNRFDNKNGRSKSKEYFRDKGKDTKAPRDKNRNGSGKDRPGGRRK